MNWYDHVDKKTIFNQLIDVVAPRCTDKTVWADALQKACDFYDIDSKNEIAMFIAQVSHESADFTRLEESLYYTPERMMVVWPTRFKTLEAAAPYARNPQALANHVYGQRYGNTGPDDGWRYRGSGVMHLTFRDNYRAFYRSTGIDVVSDPDLVRSDPYVAALTAGHYWSTRVTMGTLENVTRQINGGTNGLTDRCRRYDLALQVIAK